MAANTAPIFSLLADIQWGAADGNGGTDGPLKTANTAKDGTGTVLTVFTADATNGGWVKQMIWQPVGTNITTVGRIFINNGSTNATVANNFYLGQLSLPASTNSETAAIFTSVYPLNFALPPGYKLNVVLGTTVSAGFLVGVIGGKY